ncbi:hypothetical protein GF319_00260 [Candidatus Bathyarchaeota archaeon]|nr:hypothetical protein [Candidatus Bathyarchaeota archaeon]
MRPIDGRFWKVLLFASICFTFLGLFSLTGLRENISGDSIPNRPQHGPPIEYNWDKAVPIVILTVLSIAVAVFSWHQLNGL